MPNYVYAFFGVMSVVMLAMMILIWSEFSSFQGTTYAASGSYQAQGQGPEGAAPAANGALENQLDRIFTASQPDYPAFPATASMATTTGAMNAAGGAGGSTRTNSVVGPMPEQSIPPIVGNSAQSPAVAATAGGSAAGGIDRSETFSQSLPKKDVVGPKKQAAVPATIDTPELEGEDDNARTYSVFNVQPSTNMKSPLEKSQNTTDDTKVAIAQGMKPAVEKRKKEMRVVAEYEYGLSTELPQLGSYMPARHSAEQTAADILCDELRQPVMPKIAQPAAPTGDEALRNDFRQWTVTVRPRWRRTDYSPHENKPSSKIDTFSLQTQVTYAITDLELSAIPLLERNDVSGATDHDSFTRMGVALSPVYRLMRQQRGDLLDVNMGADAFGFYNVGDYSYVKDVWQFGGGAGLSARRTLFNFVQLGAGTSMHRSNRDAGDLGGNFNLYDFNLYSGFLLGDKWSLTPNFTYYYAQNENLPLQSWTDTELDLSYALSKAMVLTGVAGFHTTPMDSYYFRVNLGMQF